MPDAKDVILKHIAAVNDRDSDADPWAADAQPVAPGGEASGRDGVIAFLGVFQEAFPDLRLEIKQLLTDGPAAAAEGTLVGTGVCRQLHGSSSAKPPAGGVAATPTRSDRVRRGHSLHADGDSTVPSHDTCPHRRQLATAKPGRAR
jgi:SnoaL-like domain